MEEQEADQELGVSSPSKRSAQQEEGKKQMKLYMGGLWREREWKWRRKREA